MEEPIATYREVRFELSRQFEVFPDRVRIVGKGLSVGRFDGVVPLSILRPEPARKWVRGRLFRYGQAALTLTAVCVVWLLFRVGPEGLLWPWVIRVLGSLGGVGLLLVLANIRPVELAGFQTDAGVIALDVGRVGPQAQDFDEFVGLLVGRIQAARLRAEQIAAADRPRDRRSSES